MKKPNKEATVILKLKFYLAILKVNLLEKIVIKNIIRLLLNFK